MANLKDDNGPFFLSSSGGKTKPSETVFQELADASNLESATSNTIRSVPKCLLLTYCPLLFANFSNIVNYRKAMTTQMLRDSELAPVETLTMDHKPWTATTFYDQGTTESVVKARQKLLEKNCAQALPSSSAEEDKDLVEERKKRNQEMEALSTEAAKKFIKETRTQGKRFKEINVDKLVSALTSLPHHPKYQLWCKPNVIPNGSSFHREFYRLLDGPDLLPQHKEALSKEEEQLFLTVISYPPYVHMCKILL